MNSGADPPDGHSVQPRWLLLLFLVGNLPNQLFKHILQRHYANSGSPPIDNSKVKATVPEEAEQVVRFHPSLHDQR